MFDGRRVVFLCDTPPSAITDAELEQFRLGYPEETIVSKRWLNFDTDEPLARFTVRLPSPDRNLKRYGRWLHAKPHRSYLVASSPVAQLAAKTWWLYFDDIPPSKIIAFAFEPAIPV